MGKKHCLPHCLTRFLTLEGTKKEMYDRLYFKYNSSQLGLHNETIAQKKKKQTNTIQYIHTHTNDKQFLSLRMADMMFSLREIPYLSSMHISQGPLTGRSSRNCYSHLCNVFYSLAHQNSIFPLPRLVLTVLWNHCPNTFLPLYILYKSAKVLQNCCHVSDTLVHPQRQQPGSKIMLSICPILYHKKGWGTINAIKLSYNQVHKNEVL